MFTNDVLELSPIARKLCFVTGSGNYPPFFNRVSEKEELPLGFL
jgi:hypothetical protein